MVEAEGYLLSLSRYVHLNPARGKWIGRGDPVERRKRLRRWRWSSYRGYSGNRHERKPTSSQQNPQGRWRAYDYDVLQKRDKRSIRIGHARLP